MTDDAPRRYTIAKRAALALLAFAYALGVLLAIPGHMAATDSVYHFDVAARIWSGDLAPDPGRTFPWTVWADLHVDHYWGFHVLVAPFAAFASREVGMKVAAAALFGVFVAALGVAIERRRVPFPWAWAVASVLVASQDFRYLQLRGGVLMATILLAFIEAAFFVDDSRRRRVAIALIAFIAALSYNGAFVLLPLHVAGLAGLALERDRAAFRARVLEPFATLAALLLGLVINPYFDLQLSTFRFAFFNVWVIGRDVGHLFAGHENLESNPFPLQLLAAEPAWVVLLVLVAVALGWVAFRIVRRAPVSRGELVYGGLTLAGIVLTARMLRLREYSVPMCFLFLGVVAAPMMRPLVEPPLRGKICAALGLLALGAATLRQRAITSDLIVRSHPPIDMFAGARPVLESRANVPVGNLVLGDGNLLLWEWPSVQAAQGASPYFLYFRDRPLYDDLRVLRDAASDEGAAAALDRMTGRGVRLLSARAGLPFHAFASRHPELVRLVWAHPVHRACLYEILTP